MKLQRHMRCVGPCRRLFLVVTCDVNALSLAPPWTSCHCNVDLG